LSGGYEIDLLHESEIVKALMELAKCDAQTARDVIGFFTAQTQERFDKWRTNFTVQYRKRQKERAEEIYQLTKKLKRRTNDVVLINEIEKKILDLVVNP
jgi:hypothetical protein